MHEDIFTFMGSFSANFLSSNISRAVLWTLPCSLSCILSQLSLCSKEAGREDELPRPFPQLVSERGEEFSSKQAEERAADVLLLHADESE